MTKVYDVAVVGAGEMGHGFAVHLARHGNDVTLIDHRRENLDRARSRIREAVAFLRDVGEVDRSAASVLESVAFTLDRRTGVESADVVLETVAEELSTKREVLAAAGRAAPDDAVLATNTSGLSITEIAAGLDEFAPRVVGCHWWNPPYLMPLVEVARGRETADETVARTREFVEAVDRRPILVRKDVPGFVWNRIQFAVLRECAHLLAEGVASAEDIDAAVRDGYALRTAAVGPFETVDLSGVDLFESIASELYPELCADETPNAAFADLLDRGRLGVRTGAGFYEYDRPLEAVVRDRDEAVAAIRRAKDARRDAG